MTHKIDGSSAQEEIERLRREIRRHDYLYYVLAEPGISDTEYDQLMHRLQELEGQRPDLISSDSPTQRVGGAPLEGFVTITHAEPMLSLANCYSDDELEDFDRRVRELLGRTPEYVCELKIDGVAVKLTYKNRRFVQGATRGNGFLGDDITVNLRTIRSIPLMALEDMPSDFEVRGEVFYPRAEFEQMNEERVANGLKPFMNPRNGAAGTLKLLDPQEVARRPLRFFAYQLTTYSTDVRTHSQALKLLSAAQFPTNPYWELCSQTAEVRDYWNEWNKKHTTLPFDTDGIVVKLNDLRGQIELGSTAKSPRWAIAYKYSATSAITRIKGITWQVGRTGVITPVAELEPVLLLGTSVKRATLHNTDELERLGVRIGDYVEITKGGEVIPKVVRVIIERRLHEAEPLSPPIGCPVCSTPAVRDEGEVALRCPNWNCPARVKGRIIHFASRNAMDIDGLGAKTVEMLVDAGLIEDAGDLYYLRADQIIALPRQAELSAENLLRGLAASKDRSLDRLLFGLGIRYVGSGVARTLATHFRNLEAIEQASPEQLEAIPEIGATIAQSIPEFFQFAPNRSLLAKLKRAGVTGASAIPRLLEQTLAGKTFVLTGTLQTFTRNQATAEIQARGGRIGSSVSRKTDYVIAGSEAGSKLEKALKFGISVLNEGQFKQLLAINE